LEKKLRVPAYKPGDLVEFGYDGTKNGLRVKIKRIVCVESIHIEEEKEEWDGWYEAHLIYDELGYMQENNVYRLEFFNPNSNRNVADGRTLIARIGE
jgi:hypothetical protein